MKLDTVAAWLDFWQQEHGLPEIALGLERVNAVKKRFNWAETTPIITVGGTNGKGSTCAFLTEIYHQAGYRVGTLTSPHLLDYKERIAINGKPVNDALLLWAFALINERRGDITLTYFEVNVLAAAAIFYREKADVLILEVGLGGRLDAVNIFDAEVAVVTNVDLDHQQYLGNTREAIGYEKAGIFRAGKAAVIGDPDPPAALSSHAAAVNAVPLYFGRDYRCERHNNQWSFYFSPSHGHYQSHARLALPIPTLRGSYQVQNAAHALCAVECLKERLPVALGAIRKGLSLVHHPGRWQVLPGRPLIVLDVGHNPHAMRALKHDLMLLPFAKKRFAVFAILADKDVAAVLTLLKNEFNDWYIATLNSNRALTCAKIKGAMVAAGIATVNIKEFISVTAAFQAARLEAGEDDQIIVFGSFYTVAEVMTLIKNRGA